MTGIYRRLRTIITMNSTALALVERELDGADSVLDVGCGTSSPLTEIHRGFYSIGLDIFKPSLLTLNKSKFYDDLVLADARQLPFRNKVFDVVLSLDVIEHLSRQDGYGFITQISKVAKNKVVLTAPSGFLPQGSLGNNRHQKHLSGWTKDDFKTLGLSVAGYGGSNIIKKVTAAISRRGNMGSNSRVGVLANLIISILSDMTRYHLFCVKRLDKIEW